LKLWINSMIVNKGVGGVVTKDYGIYNSRLAA
jgi:hypothetical protein